MKLWGKNYTKEELLRHFGTMDRVAGLRRLLHEEGKAKGLSEVEVWTGSGLKFSVLVDKGLDIGLCDFAGIPISLRTPVGEVNPKYYNPNGDEWLRSFGGGLLVSCGLTYLGSPEFDGDEALGQHGRIHNEPAFDVCTWTQWDNDQYLLTVQGKVREAKTMRGSVLRTRTISAIAGENKISICDTITNEDYKPTPLMVLYHLNVGHPILDEGSAFLANSLEVVPRDEVASAELENYNIYFGPTQDYPDTVFYHKVEPDHEGFAQASIHNPRLGLGLTVRYHTSTLPNLVQWKYCSNGVYGAGLEPSNCWVEGRSQERARGTLQYLQPGESREYRLEIAVDIFEGKNVKKD